MERVLIKELETFIDEKVKVKGWVHKINKFGQVCFIHLRDQSGILQLVTDDEEIIDQLKLEMAIEVSGMLVKNPKAPTGIEIKVETFKVIGKTYYDLLPFSINQREIKASLEKQLDFPFMTLRRPKKRAIFKVQGEICNAFRDFFNQKGFAEIHTPKILASGTEGGSELFTVNYFDQRAFLAQSPQFYKQMMVGAGFEAVYEVGHAYRAELHNTWRHLNEYVSLDVEMGFIDDEYDLMALEEDFIKFLFQRLNEKAADALELLSIDLKPMVEIPRIKLTEAQDLILKEYSKKSPYGGLDGEGEKLICEYVKEKYDSDFVFITKYPKSKRPMYTMPDDTLEDMTKSFDLLYKGLEITTGGQRIHDYEALKENMVAFDIDPKTFDFYLEGFKYGMPPHGGFAIGLERITMQVLDLENIREACLLPRDMNRLMP